MFILRGPVPFVMSFLFTRAQWKHLALDGLRRELVRNVADVGAEVGVLRSWEARRAASVTGRVSSRPSQELLAPGRRAGPARGAGAPHTRRRRVLASQLHGRRRSRPALDHLGSGRRERSDRRTRRVAGTSTRDILGHHDGVAILSPRTAPVCVFLAGITTARVGASADDGDHRATCKTPRRGLLFPRARREDIDGRNVT